jgi:hypothetical protein
MESRFAIHQGGTKAYQVWLIRQGEAVLEVNQYGPFTFGTKPKNLRGTIDPSSSAGTRATANKLASAKMKDKSKRGYGPWENDSYPANTKGDFVAALTGLFGPRKQQDILALLFAFNRSLPVPTIEVDTESKGSTKAIAPVIQSEVSLPEWGTW